MLRRTWQEVASMPKEHRESVLWTVSLLEIVVFATMWSFFSVLIFVGAFTAFNVALAIFTFVIANRRLRERSWEE